ncbi:MULTISPECIES: ArsC/Spx/MgsR family protein [unclassified Breznakia]|uniref:ArsC/Spx/MgsR family protein n=1 Tax=unclassified Breznakia TaxID=2623764 RepID=UPI0024051E2A|nr:MULTISPECIES: ArsC/Spx/MgsR family protein [unclassified Breznakia]
MQRCPNGTEDIISTRSKAFKELKKNMDDLSINDLVDFIQENPTVLKRPIIMDNQSFVVGFDNDEITAFVPSELRNSFGSEYYAFQ